MQKRGVSPDGVSYSTFVHACVTSGDATKAEVWLERMIAQGSADGEPNAFCYNAVVQAWARQGDAERASHWLSQAIEAKAEPTTMSFSGVISAWKKAGDFKTSAKWIEKMGAAGLRSSRGGSVSPQSAANYRQGMSGSNVAKGRVQPTQLSH